MEACAVGLRKKETAELEGIDGSRLLFLDEAWSRGRNTDSVTPYTSTLCYS